MIWNIIHTEDADRNLEETRGYIRDVLQEPETAEKQVARILKAISSLDHFPLRHRVYEHEPWYSRGIRVFPVDNYLIFYWPDEARSVVEILHIIYGGRDLATQFEPEE